MGHSGGILIGANTDTFEVGQIDAGRHFASLMLHQRNNGFQWEAVVVYGPANHTLSSQFLEELHTKVVNAVIPVVIAGDFNLLRAPQDNSNNNFDPNLGEMFNDWIADLLLLEIRRQMA
jgi:hypothetical protein